MNFATATLDTEGLKHFQTLRSAAIDELFERFYKVNDTIYDSYGERGNDLCREDLDLLLEFLRPSLEFGIIQPMVNYLCWLQSLLVNSNITTHHLALSLDWIADFFDRHMAANEAKIVLNSLALIKTQFQQVEHKASATQQSVPEPWPESEAFELALLAGNRKQAEAIFDDCLMQGRDLIDTELNLIKRALYSIGEKWQNNQVTVAQEHIATALSQSLIKRGFLYSQVPTANGRKVLMACVQGNEHEVGLQIIADTFHFSGWDVQYLGANVPTDALLNQVEQYKPDLIGLSVAFAHQLNVVKEFISHLRQAHGNGHPPVIVGGLAINQIDTLASLHGVIANSSDASYAVNSATSLANQVGIPKHFPIDIQSLKTIATAVIDENGTLLDANQGFLRLLPHDLKSPLGANISGLFIKPDFAKLVSTKNTKTGESYSGQVIIGESSGMRHSLTCHVWHENGSVRLMGEYDIDALEKLSDTILNINQEASLVKNRLSQTNARLKKANAALKQHEADLVEKLLTDSLTGVGNRRRLEQALKTEIKRANRNGDKLCAIIADVDHFKRVNDDYGHQTGDMVLMKFGAILKSESRSTDIVARFGGEEFVMLLPNTRLTQAVEKADKLRASFSAEVIPGMKRIVTSSFGVAELRQGEDGESLLHRIDAALYQAKKNGRNKVVAATEL